MKTLKQYLSSTQVLPLIARSVRLNTTNQYQPVPIYTLPEDSTILMLAEYKSIFVQYIVFARSDKGQIFNAETNEEIFIEGREVEINNQKFHLVYQMDVDDFIKQADLHFFVSSMRSKYAETNT